MHARALSTPPPAPRFSSYLHQIVPLVRRLEIGGRKLERVEEGARGGEADGAVVGRVPRRFHSRDHRRQHRVDRVLLQHVVLAAPHLFADVADGVECRGAQRRGAGRGRVGHRRQKTRDELRPRFCRQVDGGHFGDDEGGGVARGLDLKGRKWRRGGRERWAGAAARARTPLPPPPGRLGSVLALPGAIRPPRTPPPRFPTWLASVVSSAPRIWALTPASNAVHCAANSAYG